MTETDENRSQTSKADDVVGAVKTAAADVKEKVSETAHSVATEAAGHADRAKEAAADEVQGIASALRTAAGELRDGSPQARTFGQIAETLANAADTMRDKDLGEMLGVASDFARRNPLVFLGSAALVGFAVTRFAKATRDASGNHVQSSGGGGSVGGAGSVDLRDQYGVPLDPSSASPHHGQGGTS